MKKELVTAILSIITAFSLIGSPVMAGQVRAASDETQAAGTQTAFEIGRAHV